MRRGPARNDGALHGIMALAMCSRACRARRASTHQQAIQGRHAMARKRTALERMRAQIAGLPRLPELVFEGGPRQLGVTVRDGTQLVQPDASLWVESPSGLVRAFELIDSHADPQRQTEQTLAALCNACAQPMGNMGAPSTQTDAGIVDLAAVREQRQAPRAPQMRPGLPARIVVVDRALAEAVRALVEPLDIPVAFAAHAPALEAAAEALGEFVDQMMPDGEHAPFSWDADAAL